MSSLLAFLNRVLPEKGVKVWATFNKGKPPVQNFSGTNEDLASVLIGLDARKLDAYFACSSFKDRSSRKSFNALAIKSFWLDIDAGKGKPYADHVSARDHLSRFIATAGLPPYSLLVCSGNGLHAYWVLEESISPEAWQPVADKLKILTKLHGLDADPSRTADKASVLRPPGTLNWKNPEQPKEVYILEEGPDVSFAVFSAVVTGQTQIPDMPNFNFGEMPKGPPDMTQGYGDGFRTDAMMQRVGYCLGPKHMTEEETLTAVLEWNKNNTPPLDEVKIEKSVRSIASRESTKPTPTGAPPIPFQKPDAKVPPLPPGYKWGSRMEIMAGLKNPDYDPENPQDPNNPKFIDVMISEFPFYIDSFREEETHGSKGDQSVRVMTKNPHGPWEGFVVDRKVLMGANWRAELGSKGVVCPPGLEKQFAKLLYEMVQLKGRENMVERSYRSFGWKHDHEGFIAGRRMYKKGQVLTVSGTTEFELAADKMAPKPKGSINAWRSAANALFAPGCEAQGLALICSFAAPLVDLVFTEEEGGSILSLSSSDSGVGKTTTLTAVETVWGHANCLRITQRESLAAQFRTIGIRGNLPVVIDEWGKMDPESLYNFVTNFTGGLDKNRLAMSGEAVREQLSWRTLLIGTTNLPIMDILRTNNHAPQANRILELPVTLPEHMTKRQFSVINEELQTNAGFAGPLFMKFIMDNFTIDELKTKIRRTAEVLGKKINADSNERFQVRLLACATVAASILSKPMYNNEPMLDFGPVRFVDHGVRTIIGNKHSESKKSAASILGEYIRANTKNFLTVPRPFNANKPYLPGEVRFNQLQPLLGRFEQENQKLYVPHEIMHKFAVTSRLTYLEFAKELSKDNVVLNRNRQTLLTAGVPEIPGSRCSCWEIDLAHELMGGLVSGLKTTPEQMALNNKLKGG